MSTSQKANLVLKIATAMKEAAVAQEAVGARYYPVVGNTNQVMLGSRSRTSAEGSILVADASLHGARSDLKDQNSGLEDLAAGKSIHHGSAQPGSIHSMFNSKASGPASAPGLQLGSSQSLLCQTAMAANFQSHVSSTKIHTGRHGMMNKSMPGHHSSVPFPRSKATCSSMSIGFNKQIMSAGGTSELLCLVEKAGEQLDFFNISSALSRVPKLVAATTAAHDKQHSLSPTEVQLVTCLAGLMEQKLHTFDARGLANAAWAFGKLKYSPKHLPGLITQRSLDKIMEFTPQNLSNMLWSHVYLQHRDEAFLKAAAGRVRAHITEFKPQELSNVVWAFASLDYRDTDLLRDAAKQSMQLLNCFKEQELSNLVWAFARAEYRDPKLFNALLQPVMAKVATLSPQGVSNIAWGLSHVGLPNAAFLKAISRHWTGRLKEFDPQALSTLTWALGAAGVKIEPLLIGLMDECLSCRDQLAPQHLSNILWACATLNFYYGPMLAPWAEAAMHAADHFEPQGLSNILWAFAKLGHFDARLMDRLADTLMSGKVDACSAQGLSNIVWAYATAGHPHTALLTRLAERMAKASQSFSAQNCSVSLWGLATLRHWAPHTFDLVLKRLATEIQAGSRNVEPQNVANSLWACARMGHDLGPYTEILRDKALKQAGRMRQQELCNCFWALAVLDCLDIDSFQMFSAHVAKAGGLSTEGLHQAFHAQLLFHSFLAHSFPNIAQPYPTLPEPLNTQAASAWCHSASDVRISRLQHDVSAALDAAGVPNRMEVLTDDGLFSIDVVVEVPGEAPAALEVDGVHHFTSNLPGTPLRDVLMRRRLLQDRGWNVINLGFQQWNDMPGAIPEEKAQALCTYVLNELNLIKQNLPSAFLSNAAHALPMNLSQDSLSFSSGDRCSSPLHVTPTNASPPHNSPSLRHSQSDQDAAELLQKLLALAPTISSSGNPDLCSNPMGLNCVNSTAADWLPNTTNCLYNYPTSHANSSAALATYLSAMSSPAMTMPSPFQAQAAPPSSPPPPRVPVYTNPMQQIDQLSYLFGYQGASNFVHPSVGLGGLGWDNFTNTSSTPNASIISNLLQGLGAAPQPIMQTISPNTVAPVAPSLVDTLLQLAAHPLPDNSWGARVAVAANSNQHGSIVQGASYPMQHTTVLPLDMHSTPLCQMPQLSLAKGATLGAEAGAMGWTVWSGLPPVLSVGAKML